MDLSKTVTAIVGVLVAIIVFAVALVPVVNDYVDGRTTEIVIDSNYRMSIVESDEDTVWTISAPDSNTYILNGVTYSSTGAPWILISDSFAIRALNGLTILNLVNGNQVVGTRTVTSGTLTFNNGTADYLTDSGTAYGGSANIVFAIDDGGDLVYASRYSAPSVNYGAEVYAFNIGWGSSSTFNYIIKGQAEAGATDGYLTEPLLTRLISTSGLTDTTIGVDHESHYVINAIENNPYAYQISSASMNAGQVYYVESSDSERGVGAAGSYLIPYKYTAPDTSFSLMSVVPMMVLLGIMMGAVALVAVKGRD